MAIENRLSLVWGVDFYMSKRIFLLMACVCTFVAAVALAGCSAGNASPVGTWYFESISATEESLANLDDDAKAQRERDAETLGIFVNDSSITFKDDKTVVVSFLGNEYSGAWEESNGAVTVTMNEPDDSDTSGTYKVKDGKLTFEANDDSSRMNGFSIVYGTAPLEQEIVEQRVGDGHIDESVSMSESAEEISEGSE